MFETFPIHAEQPSTLSGPEEVVQAATRFAAPEYQFWYIACPSSGLGATPRACRVLELDIVVYRDGEGRPAALRDRCAHRGVKLSLGRITEGKLACGYHGWRYDTDGKCTHVPSLCAHKDMSEQVRVAAYPAVEQDGYIWVWTGTGAPEPALPAPIPGFADFGWTQGTVSFNCSATMLVENQFDGAHPAFSHEGTHPAYYLSKVRGLQEYEFEVRVIDDGLISFAPPTASPDDPVPPESEAITHLQMPNRVHIHQHKFHVDFYLVLHIVATGPSTCRLEWLQREKKAAPGVRWVEQETRLIEQDRLLLESAQPAYDELGSAFERSVPADYVTLMIRRVLRLANQPGWRGELAKLKTRRLVRIRT